MSLNHKDTTESFLGTTPEGLTYYDNNKLRGGYTAPVRCAVAGADLL